MDQTESRRRGSTFWIGTGAGVLAGLALVIALSGVVKPAPAGVVPTKKPVTAASSGTQKPASTTPSPTPFPTPTGGITTEGGVVTSLAKGSYVTLVKWMPKSKTTAEEAVAFAAGQSRNGYQVVAVDGDAVKGLDAGKYGIGVVGVASFGESQAVCRALGLAADGRSCWSRQVLG